jgi:threonine/homoserine/homoserine lactone efflux protein
MDMTFWFQLVVICFLGAISPGPSLALVMGNTLAGGRIYGVVTSLGHATGIGWWALLTAVGVAEVMVDKSGILLALRSSGACLLGYIGFRTMIARDDLSVLQIDAPATGLGMLLKGAGEGLLTSVLNPKIALFFLVIFGHLVPSDSSWTETGLMGITAAVIDASWYVSVAFMLTGTSLIKVFRGRETAIRMVSGMILILIALYLLGEMLRALL